MRIAKSVQEGSSAMVNQVLALVLFQMFLELRVVSCVYKEVTQ
jgi:hypothetical protein